MTISFVSMSSPSIFKLTHYPAGQSTRRIMARPIWKASDAPRGRHQPRGLKQSEVEHNILQDHVDIGIGECNCNATFINLRARPLR